LVHRTEDLWIAYICTGLLSLFGAFFEAAKNATVPNITGERDLLAGTALMWSSRFLLMSLGAALGGWTAAFYGYTAAFIINAASFLASACSVWLIPESHSRQPRPLIQTGAYDPERPSYWRDVREGWSFIIRNRPVVAIVAANILWASGGGAINLICDRLGGLVFAGEHGISGDAAVAALYFAGGFGLFIGMMIARRVGSYVEFSDRIPGFIGWSLVVQGLVFALVGFMPGLIWASVALFLSRVLLGAEFAVQETLLMRLVPDSLRGRVSTTDRATEMLIWSFSTAVAGWSLRVLTPRSLTVVSGLLSGTAGVMWLYLFAVGKVTLPERLRARKESGKAAAVATSAD
jgi:hypothetical protein